MNSIILEKDFKVNWRASIKKKLAILHPNNYSTAKQNPRQSNGDAGSTEERGPWML